MPEVPVASRVRATAIGRRGLRYAPPAALVAALLATWQVATRVWRIEPWLLPAPSDIADAGWAARRLLAPHIWQTAQETVLGFGLALCLGLAVGLAIDLWPALREALYPLLVVSQTIPIIAVAPLLVIWFGYGLWPKIIVVTLVCFFPVAISTANGLRATDPELVSLLRTMGAGAADIYLRARLPGALPTIFAGVKIAVTYSVVGAILGEWVGASRGLGVFMLRASNSFRTDWVFASIAITSLMSVVLFGVVTAVERAWLRWYYTAAREERWEEL